MGQLYNRLSSLGMILYEGAGYLFYDSQLLENK